MKTKLHLHKINPFLLPCLLLFCLMLVGNIFQIRIGSIEFYCLWTWPYQMTCSPYVCYIYDRTKKNKKTKKEPLCIIPNDIANCHQGLSVVTRI